MDKQEIRKYYIKMLKEQNQVVIKDIDIDSYSLILAYIPMKSEVDTVPLIDKALEKGIEPSYIKADKISAKTVAIAADNGDETAIEVYKYCGYKLGKGLSILIDLLNPERIVIGSIFTRSRNLLWQYAKEVIDKETLVYSNEVCEVVPATLGEQIGDYAAIGVALLEE